MIVKTRNPIEYQNKNISNVETRGGYDGEDIGGFVSFNGDEFIPFDGQTELAGFMGADGEVYHYSFNNDEYYNAKGAKIKKFFSKEGFFGKEGKLRKGLRELKGKIKTRRATIASNVKARQDARKVKKGAKKLIAFDVAKEGAQVKKDNKKFKVDEKKARATVINQKAKEKALKDISALAKKTADNKNKNDQAIKDILNRKYDTDKQAEELAKQKAKYDKDKAEEAKENKRIEDARNKAINDTILKSKGLSAPKGKLPEGGYKTGGEEVDKPKLAGVGSDAEKPNAEGASTFQKPLPVADANTPEANKIIYKGITYNDEGNHDNIKLVDDGKGGKMFVNTVSDKDVVAVTAEDGKVDYYEKKDVDGAGMTLTTKILIGVGAVVVLGLITFLIIKRKK